MMPILPSPRFCRWKVNLRNQSHRGASGIETAALLFVPGWRGIRTRPWQGAARVQRVGAPCRRNRRNGELDDRAHGSGRPVHLLSSTVAPDLPEFPLLADKSPSRQNLATAVELSRIFA